MVLTRRHVTSLLIVLVVAVAAIPLLTDQAQFLYLATTIGTYLIVASGLNVLLGLSGIPSLGHGALVGVGAYTYALLTVDHGWATWWSLLAAVVVTAAVGAVMSIPAGRLSTWYFALFTLFFSLVFAGLVTQFDDFTHGFDGVLGVPRPSLGGETQPSDAQMFWIVLAIAVLAVALTAALHRSRLGKEMVTARDDRIAAQANGISIGRVRALAFTYSAAMAGLGGALFAGNKFVITPDDFGADLSIFLLVVVILGGAGSLAGPILGTVVFFAIPELLESLNSWRLLIYGVALLLLMRFAPHGLEGALRDGGRRVGVRVDLGKDPGETDGSRDRVVSFLERPKSERVAVVATNVGKRFGGVVALRDISIALEPGTIHAVVGPNGSGKTTFLNLVSGFYPIDEGTIRVGERSVSGSPSKVAGWGVARTFQTPKVVLDLDVTDNVIIGISDRRLRSRGADPRQLALDLLRFVGLEEHADGATDEMTHGNLRLLEIARALASRPSVLLLDEPAAGLSLAEVMQLGEVIRAIRDTGIAIVVVEHDMDLVGSVAEAVTVFNEGTVLYSGGAADAFDDPDVVAAYMGVVER